MTRKLPPGYHYCPGPGCDATGWWVDRDGNPKPRMIEDKYKYCSLTCEALATGRNVWGARDPSKLAHQGKGEATPQSSESGAVDGAARS